MNIFFKWYFVYTNIAIFFLGRSSRKCAQKSKTSVPPYHHITTQGTYSQFILFQVRIHHKKTSHANVFTPKNWTQLHDKTELESGIPVKEKVGGTNTRDIFTPVLNIQQLACRVIRPTNRVLRQQKEQVASSSCYQQTLRLKLEQMFLASVESSRTGWVTLLPM